MREVVVIGAGGGGPVLAKELAAQGLDVLVLEGGPRYADPENEWSRYENDSNSLVDGYFRVGPSDRFEKPPWYRELPQSSYLWQVSGVGGTTLHYYGNSLRATPGVFAGYDGEDRGAYDTDHRFPFAYEEFVPYYEWVEYTLPVQTAAMGTKEQTLFRGAERTGLPVNTSKDITRDSFRPQENAILQPQGTAGKTTDPGKLEFPQAKGCTFCGYCFEGCVEPRRAPRNLKAKRSTDNSYVPMMLTADSWSSGGRAVELIPDAYVTRIETEERGGETVARGVSWRDTQSGDEFAEEARVVVMAGGCTESPRLWLNSGLPNPNGWVGRGYTDHAFDWIFGVFDEYTGSSKGTGSSARVDFPGRGALEHVGVPPALEAYAMAFSDSGVRDYYDNGQSREGPWEGGTGPLLGNDLKEAMQDVDKLINIITLTDDDVEAQNRVVRSSYPADEHGPIPKVQFEKRGRSRRTRQNREFLAERAAEIIRAAGAKKVYRMNWPPLILHVQSSMRMGQNPSDSVLDENAEARHVKRLFIGDNAALPNCLGGPNPTLSSQALATRTAEKIFQKYFDGHPFVSEETPTTSIDDSVTEAVISRGL